MIKLSGKGGLPETVDLLCHNKSLSLSDVQYQLMTKSAHPHRILVIKHGALGDMVQGYSAFESLRQSFPEAHITLLTGPAFAALMAKSPWFDEVVTDRRRPLWNISESLKIYRLLKQDFGLIIDLQCSKRTSHYFRFASRTARWVGTARGCSDPLPDLTGINNAERMLISADIAGASRALPRLDWMMADMPDHLGLETRKYAVLIAGCSLAKPSKRWPAERFADIADYAVSHGLTPLLAGTAEDRQAIDAVHALCPDCVDISGKTSLSELAAVLAGAQFVVGNDTGPVFLAARCDVPTVMVMGPDTNPDMSAPTGQKADYLHAHDISAVPAGDVISCVTRLLSS